MTDFVIDRQHQMVYAQLLQWSHMLALEINTGMKASHRSPLAEMRRVEVVVGDQTYSLNYGTKKNALKALVKAIKAINPSYEPGRSINLAVGSK